MKKFILLALLVFSITLSNAQYVTIPDANFRSFLKSRYPSCFNGLKLDTTCSEIVNEKELNIHSRNIVSIEGIQYFKKLQSLTCDENKIISIPKLSDSLNYLSCNKNKITSLPSLPKNLLSLDCSFNQLNILPALPTFLFTLICGKNKLTELPPLPNNLKYIDCKGNQITSLPTLPISLEQILCKKNLLTSLPILPNNLINLECQENLLLYLPTLPSNLVILNCHYNYLSSLPPLPKKLKYLYCFNNPLECLPFLPDSLNFLGIKSTKIKCIPNRVVGNILDTVIPICTDTSGICGINSFASGYVYIDFNNNGTWDTITEPILSKQVINVDPNNWNGISVENGQYWVKLDTAITNTWSCTPPKYATVNPASYSFNPDTIGLIEGDYNFGIYFIPNINDLETALSSTVARPGFTTNIAVSVNNVGTTNQSNITVKLKKPNGYDVTATSITPTTISNDTLIWQNVSIDFLQSSNFYVELQVPKNAVLGTALLYEVWANGTQGDTTPLNNYATWTETVRGSYDPNDKLVSKTSLAPNYDVEKDRLIYTIRFQNTGTDTAFYVRVKDEIPDNLNISTLRVINASHDYQLIVREKNIVEFVFPNIFLPDSGTNEPKSHGFVQFAIQPKPGLPINTKIENNAAIYFDYNEPVITNFAITEVKLITGIANNKNLDFKLFPNPTNGQLTVDLPFTGNGSWILSDISGRQIEMSNIENGIKTFNLNLNDLPNGTYFLSIQLGNQVSTAKVMKL